MTKLPKAVPSITAILELVRIRDCASKCAQDAADRRNAANTALEAALEGLAPGVYRAPTGELVQLSEETSLYRLPHVSPSARILSPSEQFKVKA